MKIGDVVRLNSDGPYMTVTLVAASRISDAMITCSWFKDGEVQFHTFPDGALTLKETILQQNKEMPPYQAKGFVKNPQI